MILGYVKLVELETVQLNNVKIVMHSGEPKHKKMKLFLLPLICPTVSVYLYLLSVNNFVFNYDLCY